MEKKLEYYVREQDLPAAAGEILKRKLGLTARQISSAKYRPNGICVNGKQVRVSEALQVGDRLQVCLETENTVSEQIEPTPGTVDIAYEDEDLAVVNKPAGLAVHPAHGHYRDTLANYLMYEYQRRGRGLCVRAVGRLDKDTSGLVVFAFSQAAAARLSKPGMIRKEYTALVQGRLEQSEGTVTAGIRKKEGSLNMMETAEDGMQAVTHYRVLREACFCIGNYENFLYKRPSAGCAARRRKVAADTVCLCAEQKLCCQGSGSRKCCKAHFCSFTGNCVLCKKSLWHDAQLAEKKYARARNKSCAAEAHFCSLVQFHLETGRTHQIRVHMASLGHPLLEDPIYGNPGACLKNYFRNLQAPVCGMFCPQSFNAAGEIFSEYFDRAALHCGRIWIRQPFTGKEIEVTAELPEDMKTFLETYAGEN